MNRSVIFQNKRIIAVLFLSTMQWQCGAPCVVPAGELSMVVGTGGSDDPGIFTVVQNGTQVALTPGFQGGQHVWIQVRGINSCDRPPAVNVSLRRPDRSVIAFAVNNGNTWNRLDSSTHSTEWLAVQVQPNDVCRYFNGGTLTADVHLVEASGRRVDAEFSLVGNGFVPTTSEAFRQSFAACCANYNNLRCYPNGPPSPTEDSAVAPRDASGD